MKKIVGRLCSLVLLFFLCTNSVWAGGGLGYFAKGSAYVSSKSTGMGTIYVAQAEYSSGNPQASGVVDAESYRDQLEDVLLFRPVDLMETGSALPVHGYYYAKPNPGYYFKGWSTLNNDDALGGTALFPYLHSTLSQALPEPHNVQHLYLNVPFAENRYNEIAYKDQGNDVYVAETGNRYVILSAYTIENGSQKLYRVVKNESDYQYMNVQYPDPERGLVWADVYVMFVDAAHKNRVYIKDETQNYARVYFKELDENGKEQYVTAPKSDSYMIIGIPQTDGTKQFMIVPQKNLCQLGFNASIPEQEQNKPIMLKLKEDVVDVIVDENNTDDNGDPIETTSIARAMQSDATSLTIDNYEYFLPTDDKIPALNALYATFAPVQVNGCTSGAIRKWNELGEADENGAKTFDVKFSVYYAQNSNDFKVLPIVHNSDCGGTFEVLSLSYLSNEVTISVKFTPKNKILADGEHKAQITLASLGEQSKVSAELKIKSGADADKVASVIVGGNETKYATLAEALADENLENATLKLLDNVRISTKLTISKNINFDLDGWKLTLDKGCEITSNVTLKKGTIEGNVDVLSTGNIKVDGTTIKGVLTNRGVAVLNRGTINGHVVSTGTTTVEKGMTFVANGTAALTATGGETTIHCGKFYSWSSTPFAASNNGVLTFVSGYFRDEYNNTNKKHWDVKVGSYYEEGYVHFYGDESAAKKADLPVCKIGKTGFSTLEDALLYAQNRPDETMLITMLEDYVMPAGWYTLPKNATLLVPYAEDQLEPMRNRPKKYGPSDSYITPEVYRKLTLSNGVHLDVYGAIEVSCMQYIAGHSSYGCAVPAGGYGWIYTEDNVEITLMDNSFLYAWGFVTGKAEIEARRDATVYEDFQVYDWQTGTDAILMVLAALQSKAGTFPINQYAMQNVECPVSYHPGSRMYASFGATAASIQVACDEIQIVGNEHEVAMFTMDDNADADNTWVRKYYDVEKDQQVWEVNSSAHLGSVVIDLPVFTLMGPMIKQMLGTDVDLTGFDSRDFVLPITSNMKLHLLTGFLDITQNTEFLPGAELEVDKGAMVAIVDDPDIAYDGRVILFDADDWKPGYSYAYLNESNYTNLSENDPGFKDQLIAQQVRYSPTFNGAPNIRTLSRSGIGDAKFNIHGTFRVDGYLLTTMHGAHIFSNNEDAGNILFPNAKKLSLGELGELNTGIASLPDDLINFILELYKSGDIYKEGNEAALLLLNALQPIVAVAQNDFYGSGNTKLEPIILYSARLHNGIRNPEYAPTGGTGSLEILAENWQKDLGLSQTEIPADPTANWTVPGESFCYVRDRWTKMNFYPNVNIDDPNIDYDALTDYEAYYSLGAFAYNNYDEWFIKRSDYIAIATVEDVDNKFPGNRKPLENKDHTFSDAAGEGRLFIYVEADQQWWEVTMEDNLYKGTNGKYYYCEESEEEDVYYYVWLEKPFEIRFLNWDNTPAVVDDYGDEVIYKLYYGDQIKFNSTNPTREEDVDYTYTFTGWSPAITTDTKVTGDAVYVATFEATPRKYTITFLNENGTEIERHFLTRDEMPVCEDVPVKSGYYLQWEPAISAVVGDQEYRATFLPEPPTEFTVTFLNNDGSKIYSYENVAKGTKVNTIYDQAEPAKAGVDESEYNWTFAGWMPAIDDEMEVEDNMTFIAQYEKAKKTCNVIFEDENGVVLKSATAYEYGQVPVAPEYTKPATAQYTYIVTWPGLQAVTLQQIQEGEDIVYQAEVEKVTNKYTVTINATGCVVNGAGAYDYGTKVTLSLGGALAGYENPVWSDGTTADKTITVTDNVTFTASASLKEETITQCGKLLLTGDAEEHSVTLSEGDYDNPYAAFTFEAGGTADFQLFNARYLNLLTGVKAYYKYNFGAAAGKWYTFGVPFKVNGDQAVGTKTLVREKDYRIVRYNGALRAANGANGSAWEITGGTLVPGELYMIKFLTNQAAVTFTGTVNHNYDYSQSAKVWAYGYDPDADNKDAGWNGIANPALYFAQLGTGVNEAQVYNPATEGYDPYDNISAITIPVGMAAFVQVTASQPVVAYVPSAPVAVRRQAGKEDADRYVVTLSQNGTQVDKVILRSSEDAEDHYVIGEDLAKAGVSSIVGQMWVNRYGAKLCINNEAPVSGETTYPLSIFAPKAGQYTITLAETTNDMEVVLLENNVPVAVISTSFDLVLAKGTTNDYSIVVRPAKRVTTEIDHVVENAAQKVFVGGKLYILKAGCAYDTMGKLVK